MVYHIEYLDEVSIAMERERTFETLEAMCEWYQSLAPFSWQRVVRFWEFVADPSSFGSIANGNFSVHSSGPATKN